MRQYDLTVAGNQLVKSNASTFIPSSTLKAPQSIVPGRCPYTAPTPSPSPSPVSVAGDSSPTHSYMTLAIALPTVLGSALVLCLFCAFLIGALVAIFRRRRRWFDSKRNETEMIENGQVVKFTFREIDSRELKLGKLLGKGAFGKVYRGEYRYKTAFTSHSNIPERSPILCLLSGSI